jgi:hypothetical protein
MTTVASASGDTAQSEPPSKNALKKAQKEKEKAMTPVDAMNAANTTVG